LYGAELPDYRTAATAWRRGLWRSARAPGDAGCFHGSRT